jgi:hypothetical protein
MRKKALFVGAALLIVSACCVSAYAADAGGGTTAWQGFWNSVGGFLYNAMPWNWGSWMGK